MRRMYQLTRLLPAVFLLLSFIGAGAETPETAKLTINVNELTDEPVFIDWIQDDIEITNGEKSVRKEELFILEEE